MGRMGRIRIIRETAHLYPSAIRPRAGATAAAGVAQACMFPTPVQPVAKAVTLCLSSSGTTCLRGFL